MSLLPARYNLYAWEGATFRKTITWLTGGTGSQPVDLTGFTGSMDIRPAPDITPVLTLTTTNGGMTLDSSGHITLFIASSSTLTLTSGIYELLVTDTGGSGDVFGLLWGSFSLKGIA